MENSVFSSPHKILSPPKPTAEEDDVPEESGWTDYLVDFLAYNRGECEDGDEDDQENSSFISASMVSDAGSGPEWKQRNFNSNNNNNVNNNNLGAVIWSSSFGGMTKMPKRLNFKKKRTQEISSYDDSLEDTASSPVNSPKITMSFKRMDINSTKMDHNQENHMGKGIAVDDYGQYNNKINEGQEFNDNLGIQLKNKGLCLVPVSMVLDYVD